MNNHIIETDALYLKIKEEISLDRFLWYIFDEHIPKLRHAMTIIFHIEDILLNIELLLEKVLKPFQKVLSDREFKILLRELCLSPQKKSHSLFIEYQGRFYIIEKKNIFP